MPLKPQFPLGAQRATSAQIERLAHQLSKYTSITVVSGAGISTESGLSDYRSPGKLYPPRPPINHMQYVNTPHVQRLYWARSFVGYPLLSTAKPGLSHYALSALHGDLGAKFRRHITQNVDGLLQVAKVPTSMINEIHGSIHHLQCRSCGFVESRTDFQNRLIESNQHFARLLSEYEHRPDGDVDLRGELVDQFTLPACGACDAEHMIMPTIIFHGGNVPRDVYDRATNAIKASDAVLVVGSSISTYSAYRLVKLIKEQGKAAFCINYGPTRGDNMWDLKIEAIVGDTLARLADMMVVGGFQPPDDPMTLLRQEEVHRRGVLQL